MLALHQERPQSFRFFARSNSGGSETIAAQSGNAFDMDLKKLGDAIHRGEGVEVLSNGVVVPGHANAPSFPGRGKSHVRSSATAQTTPSRSGASQQTAASTTGAASPAAPIKLTDAHSNYELDTRELLDAYPATRIIKQPGGLWLQTDSVVINGAGRVATFLVAVSYEARAAKGWGFWRQNSVGVTWIGSRHTNFPDGSICAFVPHDFTWGFGAPLVALIDLYSVWALRHLYFERFGLWPGQQLVEHLFERLAELHPLDYCGCGSTAMYKDCCMQRDRSANKLKEIVRCRLHPFTMHDRQPPEAVVQTVLSLRSPPSLHQIMS